MCKHVFSQPRVLVCDFPAGWPLMSFLFFKSIRISYVMMMIMMIIIMFFYTECAGSQWVSGVNCQAQSRRSSADASSLPGSPFSLSPGRVRGRHPFVRLTAARGRQYLAHNIMHRRSHQSPQCRTLTVTRAPASQDGRLRRRARREGEGEGGRDGRNKQL